MDFKEAKKRAAQLTKEIRHHNELYYNQDAPEISDFEYDALTRELKAIEKEYPLRLDIVLHKKILKENGNEACIAYFIYHHFMPAFLFRRFFGCGNKRDCR